MPYGLIPVVITGTLQLICLTVQWTLHLLGKYSLCKLHQSAILPTASNAIWVNSGCNYRHSTTNLSHSTVDTAFAGKVLIM